MRLDRAGFIVGSIAVAFDSWQSRVAAQNLGAKHVSTACATTSPQCAERTATGWPPAVRADRGRLFFQPFEVRVSLGYCLKRPILFPLNSVNHKLPFASAARLFGWLFAVGIE